MSDDAAATIQRAAAGLLYPSESDPRSTWSGGMRSGATRPPRPSALSAARASGRPGRSSRCRPTSSSPPWPRRTTASSCGSTAVRVATGSHPSVSHTRTVFRVAATKKGAFRANPTAETGSPASSRNDLAPGPRVPDVDELCPAGRRGEEPAVGREREGLDHPLMGLPPKHDLLGSLNWRLALRRDSLRECGPAHLQAFWARCRASPLNTSRPCQFRKSAVGLQAGRCGGRIGLPWCAISDS